MKDTLTHVGQVVGTTATAWGIANIHINEALTTLSLLSATIYTIYKFAQEITRKKK